MPFSYLGDRKTLIIGRGLAVDMDESEMELDMFACSWPTGLEAGCGKSRGREFSRYDEESDTATFCVHVSVTVVIEEESR